jgi:protein-S-isoprenylcysteine O-methyltransferase Ste14
MILLYLSFAFAFSECLLMLAKKSKAATAKTRKDRGSLILIWVMITLGFTGGFLLSRPMTGFQPYLGFAFIISGLIIRWISIVQLGNSFTVDVAIIQGANLETNGIYKRIRHPSYLGILLIVTGFSLTMNSLSSFLVFVIPVLISIIYRISIEENVLKEEFGETYSLYKAKTWKLIPLIF